MRDVTLAELTRAADAADAFLAGKAGGFVYRDPQAVSYDDEVLAFTRDGMPVDDQMLVVDRATGVARFVQYPLLGPDPFPRLRPIDGWIAPA